MSIPGMGPLTSTAMLAIGKGEAFDRGRDLAAWVRAGAAIGQPGWRTVPGGITRWGSRCLPMPLVRAARFILTRPHLWPDVSSRGWRSDAVGRMLGNQAAIALTNKFAQGILRHGARFETARDKDMAAQTAFRFRGHHRVRERENRMEHDLPPEAERPSGRHRPLR